MRSLFRSVAERLRPERFFLLAAPLIYVLYNLYSPPFQVPDEINHFYRTYQVSKGDFFAEKKDGRVGGEMPVSFEDFLLHYKTLSFLPEQRLQWTELLRGFKIKVSERTIFRDFPNTALYSPVAYLPQAVAMNILARFDCSVGTLYYGGKFAIFISWLLCMFFVIRLLPFYKWLFTALFLLPMQVYLVNSLSADTMTILTCFLLVALIFRLAFASSAITGRQLAPVLFVASMLVLTKVVYVVLVLLLLIVPAEKFGTLKRKAFSVTILFVLIMAIALWWSDRTLSYHIAFADYNPDFRHIATLSTEANYHDQKEFLRQNPVQGVTVPSRTLIYDIGFYTVSYAGHFGAYMGLPFSGWMSALVYFVLLLLTFTERNRYNLHLRQRLVLFAVAVCSFAAIVLSQYVMWSPVGAERVESLQGRYLIPIVPLLLLSLGISLSRKRITMLFLLPGVIFLHVYAINLLRNRYVRENYSSSYTFDCSFETMTANGFFTTTAPGALLQANAPPAESEVRTGRGAVQLNSEGDASVMYPLRNLEQYDLMQVDVWMKGKGGQIIITGCGEKCAEFYFVNDLPQFEDERGWKRLNMTYVMPFTCGRGQIVMYLRNGSGTPVIFDDLKLLHKRGKNF